MASAGISTVLVRIGFREAVATASRGRVDNRAWLFVIGMILLLGGVLALLVGTGALAESARCWD